MTEPPPNDHDLPERIIRRIQRWILVMTAIGSAALLAAGPSGWAVSFGLGGAVAYFGYRVHVDLVDRAMSDRRVRALALKIIFRYAMIGLGVYAMIRFSNFRVAGFLIGLLLPAAAVLMECLLYLGKGIRGS